MAKVESSDGSSFLAVFEDGRWKIDDTEAVKREILKLNLLTAEEKERIKNY
jgi:hypothetical protein